jgi:hypothetical protein
LIQTKLVGLLPAHQHQAFRLLFAHRANNIETKDRSQKIYLTPSSAVCFNTFKYNGNDEIFGLLALAVAQQETVRKNSTFWRDKGGEGAAGYYNYNEDTDEAVGDETVSENQIITNRHYYAHFSQFLCTTKNHILPFMKYTTMAIKQVFFKRDLCDFYVRTLRILLSVTCIIKTK